MTRRLPGVLSLAREEVVLPEAMGEPRHLLATLFKSSTVGVAVCDRQLRFRAINDALASMNGRPASAHLGKTIHAVLGRAAAQVQPAFEHVFKTGEPLCNFEVTAKLPDRAAPGHWNEHYFPIKDSRNKVRHVGAVVLELPRRHEMESVLANLLSNLAVVSSALRDSEEALGSAPDQSPRSPHEISTRSVRLLESCLGEVRTLASLLNSAPPFQTLQPSQPARLHGSRLDGPGADFASGGSLADTLDFISPLSSREREVIALLASGKSNREIARMLTISVRTVESHRAKIMLKLNLESLSDLVRYALRNRLVQC